MASPYHNLAVQDWEAKTRELIKLFPLDAHEIYSVVIQVWSDIFASSIGSKPFRIGIDLFPQPQIMGLLLHELIALEFSQKYPELWRRGATSDEKDLVYIPDSNFSIEIKTSSSARSIYGNRSYAQVGSSNRKLKFGYYLAINFEKFSQSAKPQITSVRFGWLDHEDWLGQTAATGQQARLTPNVERFKLLKLPLEG